MWQDSSMCDMCCQLYSINSLRGCRDPRIVSFHKSVCNRLILKVGWTEWEVSNVYHKCSLACLKLGLESLCCRFEGTKRKLIGVTNVENLKISLFAAKNVRVRLREIHCNALYTLQHTENRFFDWVSLQFVDRDLLHVKCWSPSLGSLWNQCLPNKETHCDTLQRTATHWVARYRNTPNWNTVPH